MKSDVTKKDVKLPKVVSRDAWLRQRKELLAREKEFSHQRDAMSAERRKLPMVRIEKEYEFDGPDGRRTLRDLFEGKRQLIVYHFMLGPDDEEGCPSCSFVVDHFGGVRPHLGARDTSLVVISRAPLSKIEPFKKRMGWQLPWLSSFRNDFNYDFHVTVDEAHPEYNYDPDHWRTSNEGIAKWEAPGLSVFLRDGDEIYHAYSTYARGLDDFLNTYHLLDHTPLGRQEEGDEGPMQWLRHHDRY